MTNDETKIVSRWSRPDSPSTTCKNTREGSKMGRVRERIGMFLAGKNNSVFVSFTFGGAWYL